MKKKIILYLFILTMTFLITNTISIITNAYTMTNFETTYDPDNAYTNDAYANDLSDFTYAETNANAGDNWLHCKMSANHEGWITNAILVSCCFYDNMIMREFNADTVDIQYESDGNWYNICNDETFFVATKMRINISSYKHISELRIRSNHIAFKFRVYSLELCSPSMQNYTYAVPILAPLGEGNNEGWKLISHINGTLTPKTELRFINETNNYTYQQAINNNIILPFFYNWSETLQAYTTGACTEFSGYMGFWVYFYKLDYNVWYNESWKYNATSTKTNLLEPTTVIFSFTITSLIITRIKKRRDKK